MTTLGAFIREWRGYRLYEGSDEDPNVLVIVDQDGNRARFDAGDRPWEDFEDILGLLHDDLANDRLQWFAPQDDETEEADAVKALSLDEYYTTYASGYGRREAIQLPWDVVEAILGHPHEGSAEDDARLIEALVRSGAPGWVRTAEGWVDEHGWGLIGPRIEEVDADA